MGVVDRLPHFLRRQLAGRTAVQRALDNSTWLIGEQLFRMACGLFVGVWSARYLGPEQFGWLNYAIAVVGMISSFTSLGINAVIVRELVREPEKTGLWLGTAFFLRSLGAGIGFAACLAMAWLRAMPTGDVRWLVVMAATGMIFQTFDVVDLVFQSRGESKVSALVRIVVGLAINFFKVGLIVAHAPLFWFAVAISVEFALAAVGWIAAAASRGFHLSAFRYERQVVISLLKESWPLALSGFAVYAQAYFDQLVIGSMLGGEELGQYSAALRFASLFAVLPMVVQTVATPEITRARQEGEALYRRRLHALYRVMFVLFIIVAIPLVSLGPWATRLVYGASYAGASALLPWLAFRLFFTNMGIARSVFLTNEGIFRFGLITAVAGAAVNILLNFFLVPHWGVRGAILSSFASFAVTTFALEVFHPRARENVLLMASAVLLPWRSYPR